MRGYHRPAGCLKAAPEIPRREGIGGEPGKVDVINLVDMSLSSSVNVGKQAGGIAFWKISD